MENIEKNIHESEPETPISIEAAGEGVTVSDAEPLTEVSKTSDEPVNDAEPRTTVRKSVNERISDAAKTESAPKKATDPESTGLFEGVAADVREFLRKIGITASEAKIRDLDMRLSRIRNYVPKIGFFGKTGAGKSSLCNVLFGADTCKVGHAGSVTRDIQELAITVNGKRIVLIDVPGVGEDRSRDREYHELYRKLLPSLDIIIWVQKADDRAFTDVQNAYLKVFKPYFDAHPTSHIPFVIALNQVDKVEPTVIEQDGELKLAWNTKDNCPSAEQLSNIEDIMVNIGSKIPVGDSYIVPVSASRKYNLYRLIRAMLRDLPAEKISLGDAFSPALNLNKPKSSDAGRMKWTEWLLHKMEATGSAKDTSGAGAEETAGTADPSAAPAGFAEAAEEDDAHLYGQDETEDEEWEDEEDDADCEDDEDDEYDDEEEDAEETRRLLRQKRWEAVKETVGSVFGLVAEGGRAVVRGIKKFAGWIASKLFG